MNGRERVLKALRGEQPDGIPIMLHNFMAAAREAGVPMREFRRDPEAIAKTFLQAVETYRYDGIVLDVDTSTLAEAVGCPVNDPDDLPAACTGPCLGSLEEAADLEPPDLTRNRRVQVWLEATALLRKRCGGEVSVRGNCDQAPYSLAALMRSPQQWMLDMADPDRHEAAFRLLEFCTGVSLQFLSLMAGAGAHVVSNGDSWAGSDLVSPRIYRSFAAPYEARLAARAHQLGLPYIIHICGKTDPILEDIAATGADGVELDYKTDARRARAALEGRAAFIGNIDPSGVLALGSSALVEEKTRELLRLFDGCPRWILNGGCALPATTPPANIHALVRTARGFRKEAS